MQSGTNFEDTWKDYCRLCEWREQCCEKTPCGHFQPYDLTTFQVAEIVDDQNARQAEYLLIVADFGGGE